MAASQRPLLATIGNVKLDYDNSQQEYKRHAHSFLEMTAELELALILIEKNQKSLAINSDQDYLPAGATAIFHYLQALNILNNGQEESLITGMDLHQTMTAGLPYMGFKKSVRPNPQLVQGHGCPSGHLGIYVVDASDGGRCPYLNRKTFDKAYAILHEMGHKFSLKLE